MLVLDLCRVSKERSDTCFVVVVVVLETVSEKVERTQRKNKTIDLPKWYIVL